MDNSGRSNNPLLLTLPELISAKEKLARAAANFQSDKDKDCIKGFESRTLSPSVFKEQLRRNFLVNVTRAELGALVFNYDKYGDNTVDSASFLKEFFRLGAVEKQHQELHKARELERRDRLKTMLLKSRNVLFQSLTRSRVEASWTDEDENSVISKIANAAFEYDHSKGGLAEFFKCEYMAKEEFRQIMRRVFLLNISAEEVSALFNLFDPEHNEALDTKKFVTNFFITSRVERDVFQSRKRDEAFRCTKRYKEIETGIKQHMDELLQPQRRDSTNKDQNSLLQKMAQAAVRFKFGALEHFMKVKGFESAKLTPSQFREQLRFTFNVHVTAAEVDAAVRLFDVTGTGEIDCGAFLKNFFHISSQAKEYLQEKERKAAYRVRVKDELRLKQREEHFKRQCLVQVKWPSLPAITDAVEPSLAPSTILSPEQPKKQRKPAAFPDALSYANREKNARSVTAMFPNISSSTKDFLKQIEEEEKEISRIRGNRSRKKSKPRDMMIMQNKDDALQSEQVDADNYHDM